MLLKLDLQFFAGEKTEKATPKKRQDARKKGQVLKSQDVTSAFVLLAIFMYLLIMGSYLRKFINIFRETFTHTVLIESISVESVMEMFKDILVEMAIILLPIMAIAMIAAVAANFFNSVCFSQLKR